MPSDLLPKPAPHGRGLRWFVLPAVVAIILVGLFMLLSHILTRTTPIETDLAAAMSRGMTAQQRIDLSARVVDMLDRPARGQPDATLLLLSLGRIWQPLPQVSGRDGSPSRPGLAPTAGVDTGGTASAQSTALSTARHKAAQTLLTHLASPDIPRRKATALAFAFWKTNPETAAICPRLIDRLNDPREALDVRITAAVSLGAISQPSDKTVIAALEQARNLADERQAELAWNAALALARLGQPSATGTLLKLLDRRELSQLTIYDRESDPRNPQPRKLTDYEIERFLINAIEASSALPDPAATDRLRQLAQSDPSARVRTTASNILSRP